MQIEKLAIPQVKLLHTKRHEDERGYFCETYNQKLLAQSGIDVEFVQDNLSFSAKAATVRGLHFQCPPFAQAKLVRVQHGAIYDVAVDLRQSSPTFGKYVGVTLSADNGHQLFVPAGFAHGFMTLENHTVVAYKVSSHYAPAYDGGLLWNDPGLGIEWPLSSATPILSEKDQILPSLSELENPFS